MQTPYRIALFATVVAMLVVAAELVWFRSSPPAYADRASLVLQSDFGSRDGAVAAMKGVATGVDAAVRIFDLTHEIAPFDIWEAAYRLRQVTPYWPTGTVFVSIVDPGVGTGRLGVVARTARGHLIVTPDNGALTLLAAEVEEVREIDLTRHRLPGSERSHTFHGRDVFAYLGARLASGQARFDEVGPSRGRTIIRIEVAEPVREGGLVRGMVGMIDRPYGNLWTTIPSSLVDGAGFTIGDTLLVRITNGGRAVFTGRVPFVESFGHVRVGEPVVYLNSLLDAAIAINQGSFAERHGVGAGPTWVVSLEKTPTPSPKTP